MKFLVFCFLMFPMVMALFGCAEPIQRTERALDRIAHAGGGYNTKTYTNSLDALNHNADSYVVFEIDFSFTRDGKLVCMHDWEASIKRSFGVELDQPPTLSEFEDLVAVSKIYKKCTLATLAQWVVNNPTKRSVTDIKDHNIKALKQIADAVPDFADRFIPQVYQEGEYEQARSIGYRNVILTI